MADQIDAQERLEAVNNLITSCDSIANEIENSFSQFDATLADAEGKSKELISDIDTAHKEVTTHADNFMNDLMNKVGEISQKTEGFVVMIGDMLETIQSNGDQLFANLNTMDTSHDEIVSQINQNVAHMQGVFESLTNVWTSTNDQIQTLQEQGRDNIDQNVRNQSETMQSEQDNTRSQFSDTLLEGFNELISGDVQPHINTLAQNLTGQLIPHLQSQVQENRETQEQGGADFTDLRNQALETTMGAANQLLSAVTGTMGVMTATVGTTSTVADVTVDAMDQTNIGLNQLNEAVENVISLLGGLSLD